MRRLLYLLLISALSVFGPGAYAQPLVIGPGNAITCNKIANLTAGPTTITQIVAAVTNQAISICGWSITNTAAAGTFSLSYGTGSNCGTGTTAITAVQSVGSTAVTDHQNTASFSTPLSQALCITPSVGTIAGVVYYSQQ